MATVTVIIDENAEGGPTTKYEVEGVIGSACDDLTKALRDSNEELEYEQTAEHCEEQERPAWLEEGE